MIVLRLLFAFILITIVVCLGVYLLSQDRRYLGFAWQVSKFLFVLLVLVALLYSISRIILF